MIAVYQHHEHDPPRTVGDCHAACIASLLEVELDEVPAITLADLEDVGAWWRRLGAYLAKQGLYLLKVPAGAGHWSGAAGSDQEELWIACGKSPRSGVFHCVVCRGAEVVHDPHPSGRGIESVDTAEFLVLLDPARLEGVR